MTYLFKMLIIKQNLKKVRVLMSPFFGFSHACGVRSFIIFLQLLRHMLDRALNSQCRPQRKRYLLRKFIQRKELNKKIERAKSKQGLAGKWATRRAERGRHCKRQKQDAIKNRNPKITLQIFLPTAQGLQFAYLFVCFFFHWIVYYFCAF